MTTLRTLLGSYHNTLPLKARTLTSPRVDFEFDPARISNRRFKAAVRENAFDVAELALVTFLMAKARGWPYVLMPAVTGEGRWQHQCLVYNAERHASMKPADLHGKRVGIRAWSQTTVTWVRGIIADDCGVDLGKVHWVTFEGAHVDAFEDPPGVERAPEGSKLVDMLLAGELDAAVIGSDLPADDPRIRPLIPQPFEAAKAWSDRHGALIINHMVAVPEAMCRERPELVREVWRLLKESKRMAGPSEGDRDMTPFGLEANRTALELIIRYSHEQGLIPRRFEVDELFDDVTRGLA